MIALLYWVGYEGQCLFSTAKLTWRHFSLGVMSCCKYMHVSWVAAKICMHVFVTCKYNVCVSWVAANICVCHELLIIYVCVLWVVANVCHELLQKYVCTFVTCKFAANMYVCHELLQIYIYMLVCVCVIYRLGGPYINIFARGLKNGIFIFETEGKYFSIWTDQKGK